MEKARSGIDGVSGLVSGVRALPCWHRHRATAECRAGASTTLVVDDGKIGRPPERGKRVAEGVLPSLRCASLLHDH